MDEGPYNVPRAKEVKLVDEVGYEADVRTLIKKKFDDAKIKLTKNYGKKKVDADLSGLNGLITLMNALAGAPPSGRKSSNPKIGVLYGSGAIMTSAGTESLLLGEILESHTMIKAIRELRDDDTVKAVVIRIDSPGGSALASDLIWHELEELNKKKPLVASMSDVAGSGGYYIAMGADKIYAAPGTVTGSIGVVGGKVALEKTYEKLGIHVVTLERGKNSGLMSVTTPFTDSQREKTHRMMKEIYDQFTQKAADGRKMDVEKLEKLARGRIYSGERAKELGLVDEVGSLGDAIAKARELANLKEGDKVDRLELPKAVSPLEQLLGPVGSDARMARTIEAALNTAIPNWSVIARDLTAFRQLSHEPAITVMPFRINLH